MIYISHRHPRPREEDDCELAHRRHFNVVKNLIHQPVIELSYPAPRGMIKAFCEKDVEAVRAMFISLFDENRDFAERARKFESDADAMKVKYDDGTWKQHYQGANAISTYLWLRFPDKYYIYKYSEYRTVASILKCDYTPKKGHSNENLVGGYNLYDEFCAYLKNDEELVKMLRSVLTDMCYPDKELKTLTIDIGFYISRYYSEKLKPNPEEALDRFDISGMPESKKRNDEPIDPLVEPRYWWLNANPKIWSFSKKECLCRCSGFTYSPTDTRMGQTKMAYHCQENWW